MIGMIGMIGIVLSTVVDTTMIVSDRQTEKWNEGNGEWGLGIEHGAWNMERWRVEKVRIQTQTLSHSLRPGLTAVPNQANC